MYIELIVNPFDFGAYEAGSQWLVHAHFQNDLISDITIDGLSTTFDALEPGYRKLLVRALADEGTRLAAQIQDEKWGPV